MSSANNNLHSLNTMFSTQSIILAHASWGALALLSFLLFSVTILDLDGMERHANWSVIGTNIFEGITDLTTNVLCLRDWRSLQTVISQHLGLAMDIDMVSDFLGGILSFFERIIAVTAFSLDSEDIWFQYTTTWIKNYQSKEILEVFWVWSGVLFGISTVLEYDASLNCSRRAIGRKQV